MPRLLSGGAVLVLLDVRKGVIPDHKDPPRPAVLLSSGRPFDPARHGFGFPNPTGGPVPRTGGRLAALGARVRRAVYGRGLCFGMALGALLGHARDLDAAGLAPSPPLLADLRRLHLLQFRPCVVARVVFLWLSSRGGRPKVALRSLAPPGRTDLPPAVLCFGPDRLRRGFLGALAGAHAVVPYRLETRPESVRVYVYDPNHPKDRGRYLTVHRSGGFEYGGFSTGDGWGITLVPLSALPDLRRFPLREARGA
ncbi:Hypothetical Protein RradSPS_0396 [Rubrobacter radiotolerans]|uniref:Uncharacterized protein n=1 Tax=Rubrobacter radiotolerans TaxID=42256 RepID=A0A023X0T9_RUBRA|nr:hypothetical protein [Rubrobacter radiotolerans]AHY45679.1 Hypothetical Protein RradSPS_0396 [Rubrobacter radiotolerans]MDX5893093.1 hypothetical protein [Rubrobacter radiotolerans]SMC03045.1 hypothetical protein SAMN00767673_0396 [Rubrobacter radiotolerans DSM 5868]